MEKDKENKSNKKKEPKCPLCEVSEETLKVLKEATKEGKLKEKSENNGESKNNPAFARGDK